MSFCVTNRLNCEWSSELEKLYLNRDCMGHLQNTRSPSHRPRHNYRCWRNHLSLPHEYRPPNRMYHLRGIIHRDWRASHGWVDVQLQAVPWWCNHQKAISIVSWAVIDNVMYSFATGYLQVTAMYVYCSRILSHDKSLPMNSSNVAPDLLIVAV